MSLVPDRLLQPSINFPTINELVGSLNCNNLCICNLLLKREKQLPKDCTVSKTNVQYNYKLELFVMA